MVYFLQSANTEGAGKNLALYKRVIDQKVLECDVATMYMMNRNPNDVKHLVALPISNDSYVMKNGNSHFIPQDREVIDSVIDLLRQDLKFGDLLLQNSYG